MVVLKTGRGMGPENDTPRKDQTICFQKLHAFCLLFYSFQLLLYAVLLLHVALALLTQALERYLDDHLVACSAFCYNTGQWYLKVDTRYVACN